MSRFNYTVKAHPTMYNGVQYRSRLEARWAAFFDLIGWKHEYEPIDLPGWSPDFRVVFPCGHSECPSHHSLLVEVKPFFSLKQFEGHPCLDYLGGIHRKSIPKFPEFDWANSTDAECHEEADRRNEIVDQIASQFPADSSAAFGANPEVTHWSMSHGSGGGDECLLNWIEPGYSRLWSQAGNAVQWQPKDSQRPPGKLSAIIWDEEQKRKRNAAND